MTKNSAEEKIVQIGRKKMALDHVLIESMDAEDDAGVDLESILKHGAEALFNDNDQDDIHYDSKSVDELLMLVFGLMTKARLWRVSMIRMMQNQRQIHQSGIRS
jgi:hypothetical protein